MRYIPARLAIAAVVVGLTIAPSASAHNAGHVIRPDGSCQQVGSFKSVVTGPDDTSLDLYPATPNPPYDEVGTSFAAYQGNSAVRPGPC